MDIQTLCKEAHENAEKHGFWEDYQKAINSNTPQKLTDVYTSQFLMLIVSEIGEAQEGLRHGDYDNFKEELADTCIRIFDLCGGLDIDLENEIIKKMEINKKRPYKHNKAF